MRKAQPPAGIRTAILAVRLDDLAELSPLELVDAYHKTHKLAAAGRNQACLTPASLHRSVPDIREFGSCGTPSRSDRTATIGQPRDRALNKNARACTP